MNTGLQVSIIENIKEDCKNDRERIIKMINESGTGHPGGALSCVEILNVIFSYYLDINKVNIKSSNRDHFILSKGHAAPSLYAILYRHNLISEEELYTYRKFGSRLQGHPEKELIDGIDCSTGSLGMGMSVACGMALSNRKYKVAVLVGDGELQEGSNWEAVMFASHNCLGNLVAFVDNNKYQLDGCTKDIISMENLDLKFSAFGWETYVVDGHNIDDIVNCIDKFTNNSRPKCIICETVKGKGFKELEKGSLWHSIRDFKEFQKIKEKYYG